MESKAESGWADQDDVAAGAAPQDCASAPPAKPPSMERNEWNRRYAVTEFPWTVEANRFLVAEAAKLPPGRALDLATGEGRNAVWLAEQGWDVLAVDVAEVALQKGPRLAIDCLVRARILS